MKRIKPRQRKSRLDEPAALELIGEAVHLLRQAPPRTILLYLVGTVPCVLGMLFFWTDMSRSAFAYRRCAAFALLLAFLFIWMKLFHTAFAAHLRNFRCQGIQPSLSVGRWLRTAASQAFVHATGIVILPVTLIVSIPFPWAYAFYQNATATPLDHDELGLRATVALAWRNALVWPRQNWALITILYLFAFVVFLNILYLALLFPYLLKILFGVQSIFTVATAHMFNTTLLATAVALAFLVVDPVIKTVYMLRCFYTASQQTGADLRAAMRRLRRTACVLALMTCAALASNAQSQTATEMRDAPAARQDDEAMLESAAELDEAIQQTIEQPQYAWRLPRTQMQEEETESGFVAAAVRYLIEKLVQLRDWLQNWIDRISRWMRRLFPKRTTERNNWLENLADWRAWIWFTLIVVVVVLLVALIRYLRKRRTSSETTVEAVSITPVPDLTREDVTADELPEDEWLRLAAELLSRGDYRFGLRALFLASLAALARRNLLVIARFKSDRDYQKEIARKAHALPEMVSAFSANVGTFERIWYGYHDASEEALAGFRANLSIILDEAAVRPAKRSPASDEGGPLLA